MASSGWWLEATHKHVEFWAISGLCFVLQCNDMVAETDSNIIYGCLSNVLRNIVYKVALLELLFNDVSK